MTLQSAHGVVVFSTWLPLPAPKGLGNPCQSGAARPDHPSKEAR